MRREKARAAGHITRRPTASAHLPIGRARLPADELARSLVDGGLARLQYGMLVATDRGLELGAGIN